MTTFIRRSKILTVLVVSACASTARESAATIFFRENFDDIPAAELPWNAPGNRNEKVAVDNCSFKFYWSSNDPANHFVPPNVQITAGEGRNGTNAARINFWNKATGSGTESGLKWRAPAGFSVGELYVRFYVKFVSPWPQDSQIGAGLKMGRYNIHDPNTGTTIPGGGSILPDFSYRHVVMVTRQGNYHSSRRDDKVLDGKYHCMEYHLKLNTPGVANGVVEWWVDGTKVINVHNWLPRVAGTEAYSSLLSSRTRADGFTVGGNMPGLAAPTTKPNRAYVTMWYDDVVLSDTYNGPTGAGDATAP